MAFLFCATQQERSWQNPATSMVWFVTSIWNTGQGGNIDCHWLQELYGPSTYAFMHLNITINLVPSSCRGKIFIILQSP